MAKAYILALVVKRGVAHICKRLVYTPIDIIYLCKN